MQYRYKEEMFLKDLEEYIKSTYDQHYVGKDQLQVVDIWDDMGSAWTTCRDTAMKYLKRYGRKNGFNQKDLLKAAHYIVLMSYFAEKNNMNDVQWSGSFVVSNNKEV